MLVFIIRTTVTVGIMNGIKIIPLFHCHHQPIDCNKIRYSECFFYNTSHSDRTVTTTLTVTVTVVHCKGLRLVFFGSLGDVGD